jgi:branched-chain amino acid transport system substrate-binding protein
MSRTRTMAAVVALSTAIGVGAAACDDGSGSGSGGSTDAEAVELTGDPVKIMVTGVFTSFGNDYTQVPEAAQAAASAIEAEGGINGSPIEIVECEVGGANEAAECGRLAVEEGVVATVGTFSNWSDDFLPILEEAGIPQVAPYPIAFSDYTSPINYPLFGGALSVVAGMGAQLADDGAETVNVTYLNIAEGAFAADLVAIGTDPRGAEIISETPVAEGTVEFSPQVASATADDPDGIAALLVSRDSPGFLRALSQSGYEGKVATATSSITPAQLEELGPVVEGMLIPSGFKPATLTDDPTVQQFNKEMDQYAPDAVRDDTAENAWLGMHLIADLMDGKGKVTAAKLTDALDTTGKIDLGLIPPIDFKHGAEIPQLAPGLETRIFNSSVVYTVVEDSQLVAVDGKFVDVLEE